jgi:hypothetical protein
VFKHRNVARKVLGPPIRVFNVHEFRKATPISRKDEKEPPILRAGYAPETLVLHDISSVHVHSVFLFLISRD